MEHLKKTYKPKADKLIKLQTFYTLLKNEKPRNNENHCPLFRQESNK